MFSRSGFFLGEATKLLFFNIESLLRKPGQGVAPEKKIALQRFGGFPHKYEERPAESTKVTWASSDWKMKVSSASIRSGADVSVVNEMWPAQRMQPASVSHSEAD